MSAQPTDEQEPVTCARCHYTAAPTPSRDFYTPAPALEPYWPEGGGLLCESCHWSAIYKYMAATKDES